MNVVNGTVVRMLVNGYPLVNETESTIEFGSFNLAYVSMVYDKEKNNDTVEDLKKLINLPIEIDLTDSDTICLYKGEAIILRVKVDVKQNSNVMIHALIELITHDDR